MKYIICEEDIHPLTAKKCNKIAKRHLENIVQYQYNWGPLFNYLKITLIHLYNFGNEFIFVYLVKILQNKSFLEKLVLPLKLLL